MKVDQVKKRTKKDIISRRYVALFIDYLILCIYAGILFLLSPIVAPLFQKSAWQSEVFGLILLVTPVFLYFFLFETSQLKATPGKMLLHLKVIKTDGKDFNFKSSFIRSLIKFIPWEIAHFAIWQAIFPNSTFSFAAAVLMVIANIIGIIYFVFPFFNKDARAIHDIAANTILVIKL